MLPILILSLLVWDFGTSMELTKCSLFITHYQTNEHEQRFTTLRSYWQLFVVYSIVPCSRRIDVFICFCFIYLFQLVNLLILCEPRGRLFTFYTTDIFQGGWLGFIVTNDNSSVFIDSIVMTFSSAISLFSS